MPPKHTVRLLINAGTQSHTRHAKNNHTFTITVLYVDVYGAEVVALKLPIAGQIGSTFLKLAESRTYHRQVLKDAKSCHS